MVFVDFKCETCGFMQIDVLFRSSRELVQSNKCPECDGKANRVFTGGNFIHPTLSTLYGKYEPALDMVVKDYAHKQQLMREFNITEANDTVKGSRNDRAEKHKAIKQRHEERAQSGSASSWTTQPRGTLA